MLFLTSILQSPLGPCRAAMPTARSYPRVNRTKGALPFLGRFHPCDESTSG
jgi:hypothetical protein